MFKPASSIAAVMSLCIVFFATTAFCAIYFVDHQSGSDTHNGLSASTPWKHCPGDDLAKGKASRTKLTPGDTVIFKGGVIYQGVVHINWSGTSGKVITYDGNSAGTWGAGKAIIDGEKIDSDTRRYGFHAKTPQSHITIQNFEIKRMGGGSEPKTCSKVFKSNGYGIFFGSGGSHIIIRDCKIWDIGNWENRPYQQLGGMSGRGIYFRGASSSVLIENNELTRMGDVVIGFAPWVGYGNEVTNIEIRNNQLHGFSRWGIYIGLASSHAIVNDIKIHSNSIYDSTGHTPWQGCAGKYPHWDGIMLTTNRTGSTSLLGTPDNPVRIYNNRFYYDTEAKAGGGTAEIFLTAWGGTVYIYNNTFKNILSSGGAILLQGMSSGHPADFHIYNNSFYGGSHGVRVRDLGGVSFTGAIAVNASNNAFHHTNPSTMAPISGIGVPITHFTKIDNNIFFTARSGGQIAFQNPKGVMKGYTVDELNDLDNASGNIPANAAFFRDLSHGLGQRSSLNDLRLRRGSPAINAGLNFSSFFTSDIMGSTRPYKGPWDIGAYKH